MRPELLPKFPEWLHEIYTTAPRVFDGHGTLVVTWKAGTYKDQPVRVVRIPTEFLKAQLDSYKSGQHLILDAEEWKNLLEKGRATTFAPN